MSFWNDDLKGCEAISESFRDEIERVMGAVLARREFTIVSMLIRGTDGIVYLEVPKGTDVRGASVSAGSSIDRWPIADGRKADPHVVLPDLQRPVHPAARWNVCSSHRPVQPLGSPTSAEQGF